MKSIRHGRVLLPAFLLLTFLCSCSSSDPAERQSAEPEGVITELSFPETTEEIAAEAEAAIAEAESRFRRILAASPRTFENTVAAVDSLIAQGKRTANKYLFLSMASPDAELSAAAGDSYLNFAQWYFYFLAAPDLHAALTAFDETSPSLEGEDRMLREKIWRTLRIDGGMGLEGGERIEYMETALQMEYLKSAVQVNVIAGEPESNSIPLLDNLIQLRAKAARIRGYESWADLKTERSMAGTGEEAMNFLRNLSGGLDDRFAGQAGILLELKRKDVQDPQANLYMEDVPRYQQKHIEEAFQLEEGGRERVFSYDKSLAVLFRIAREVFDIDIRRETLPGPVWHGDVGYYIARDVSTGDFLGSFYLDPFRREGKNNWPRVGIISEGWTRHDGRRALPALVFFLDFSKPADGTSPVLRYDSLKMLFHEFGHLLHFLCGKGRYANTDATTTNPDFTEIFSQLLEQWTGDLTVLEEIAAIDPATSHPFPTGLLAEVVSANRFFSVMESRLQMMLAVTDLRLHTDVGENDPIDSVHVYNAALAEFFLPYA